MAESQLTPISDIIRYMKAIDPLNAKIISECARLGPNNLTKVAKSLKIPIETVRYRLRKLRGVGILNFGVFVRYSRLGLVRCSLFASASPQREKQLGTGLATIQYWTYLARCFGRYEGYYCVYALPYANRFDFEQYLSKVKKLGIMEDYHVVYTGDSFSSRPDFRWFDFQGHFWVFPWDKWEEELESKPADRSHPALTDPVDYTARFDVTDIQILSRLEEDARRGLSEIGRQMNLTAAGVKYHWDHHIAGRGVVSGYRTITSGYPKALSDVYTFLLQCKDKESLARLVTFLSDKVFAGSFAKILGEDSLILHVLIPKTEFEGMITFMHDIRTTGPVRDFSYVRLDIHSFSASTTRPENLKNGHWTYSLESQLERLQASVVQTIESSNRDARFS